MAIGARARFWLTYAVIAALVTIPFSVTLFFVWLDMDEVQRNLLRMIAPHWLPIGTAVTVLSLVLAGVALHRLYRVYVQGLAAMAEQLDVMRTAPSGFRIPSFGPPEVRRVAEAANRLAEAKEAAVRSRNAIV
jgi:DNA polymerase-3 subunit epsilon